MSTSDASSEHGDVLDRNQLSAAEGCIRVIAVTRNRVAVGAAAAIAACFRTSATSSARASTWSPTATELSVGLGVAHAEANTSIPSRDGSPLPASTGSAVN